MIIKYYAETSVFIMSEHPIIGGLRNEKAMFIYYCFYNFYVYIYCIYNIDKFY